MTEAKKLFDLTGRVAIVTGAGSGLGKDACTGYVESGANVALLDVNIDAAEEAAKALNEKYGCDCIAVACDVTDEASVKAAVETVIAKYGKIDILFNDAAITRVGSVVDLPQEEWDRVQRINVKGPYLMCKYVIPHMMEAKYGKIVNMSAVFAVRSHPFDEGPNPAYGTSKAAVIGLTTSMAATYAKHGITVNAIAPAHFRTPMTENTFVPEMKPFLDYLTFKTPMGRFGEPGELNGPILFFSSDASSYVTGQLLPVDGGYTTI